MESPALGFQSATFAAFDHTRTMTDSQCRAAEIALVEAAIEHLSYERGEDLRNEVNQRPPRAFRYLVLDTFRAVSGAMSQAEATPEAFGEAITAYLQGDPKGVLPFVQAEHLGRYLDVPAH